MESAFALLDKTKAIILLVRIFSLFISLGYIKIYTHYLSLPQLGIFFYLSTISYFLNAVVFVPADLFQQTHISADRSVPIPFAYALGLNARAILIAVVFVGGVFIYSLFDKNLTGYEVVLAFFLSIFLFFCTSLRALLNNRSHGIFVVFMLMVEASLKVVLFFAIVYTGSASADALILSNIAALAVEFAIIGYFFYSYEKFDFAGKGTVSNRDFAAFCYPISISAVCNWLQLQGYRLVYVWFGHAEIAGLYATISNIGSVGMSATGQIYSQLFLPRIYQTRGLFIKNFLVLAMAISVVVLLAYAILGPFILGLLTKGGFKPFYKLMLFGVLVEASNLMIGAITAFSGLIGRTGILITSNLIGVVFSVATMGFALVVDPTNPYLTGASLGISQAVTLLFLAGFVRRAFASGWVPNA